MGRRFRDCLEVCATAFDRERAYTIPDGVIRAAFARHPGNTSLDDVVPKVVLLKTLYRTEVLDWWRMAKHVRAQRLDALLKAGDLRAVARLRKGHGIGPRRGSERDFYSFATKYCHWHRADKFPMYDKWVALALGHINARFRFLEPWAKGELRRDYSHFVRIVDACRDGLGLKWPGYKRLDQALWVFGHAVGTTLKGRVAQTVRLECSAVLAPRASRQ
jgi:hypothetical protein